MAWPRCPHCGERNLTDGQRADEVTPAESTVFRSWPCRRCGKILWTAETVFCDDAPTVHLGRKFVADFESSASPSRLAPGSGDSETGAGTSGPRNAPEALPGEMRGIRRTA